MVITPPIAKVLIVFFFSIPMLFSLFANSVGNYENRKLVSFPTKPASLNEVYEYPKKLDAWINDNFGLRLTFIRLNNWRRYYLFNQLPSDRLLGGLNGRIFLAAHTPGIPYSAITIPCGYSRKYNDKSENTDWIVNQLNTFDSTFRGLGFEPKLLIPPSAPTLYNEELPSWLRGKCTPPFPLSTALLSSKLKPYTKESIYFPIEHLRELKETSLAYPKHNFHWEGDGPRLAARHTIKLFWNLDSDSGAELVVKETNEESELASLAPGLGLRHTYLSPDFASSGIKECHGQSCIPELNSIASHILTWDTNVYENPKAPYGKLIIISDSFGRAVAKWYPQYFKKVIHLNTNIGINSKSDSQAFRQFVKNELKDAKLLFVYYDMNILTGNYVSKALPLVKN